MMIRLESIREWGHRILRVMRIVVPVSIVFVGFDYFMDNDFLYKFLMKDSLQIMGTILSIYVATSAAFWVIVMKYKDNVWKNIEANAKEPKEFVKALEELSNELRNSALFILFVFSIHFFVLIAIPDLPKDDGEEYTLIALMVVAAATFATYFYALYDLISVLFSVGAELVYLPPFQEKSNDDE